MVDGVHGNTSNLGPLLLESSEFVELSTCLQDRFIGSSSTSDDTFSISIIRLFTNSSSALSVKSLSGSGRKSDSGSDSIIGVTDDCCIASGSSSQSSFVSWVLLDVANDSTLREFVQRKYVSSGQLS